MKALSILIVSSVLLVACKDHSHPQDQQPAVIAADTIPAQLVDGHQTITTQDGGRMEGDRQNGQRSGLWKAYFPDGSIRSYVLYMDGLEEGETEVFHPTGKTYYSGQYHKGKNVGEWIFYDDAGKELKRVVYDSAGVVVK